ncbi:MAG: phosphate ABC transporter, permease protein PstA [Bdellovibrionales bacterium RIFOXYD12_FULL_39_22]|nr:MAG: phosphate ABC transporter, permease protein PstA [Bdellovibrionales bacterium RIFOXYB1_FULL_39_21]OFZ42045.1 MAG: phosphate ABC transporter, permease protein PstA [Bdellovibrionales bacterium RIFOXYC12_FULL_39_17]OFZ50761.1 MAG: phosphate ABC transporter, permease protein PstA [Bdellovibrionales bacterium RIFOXYC1_FULL_39_130]OFZ77984.1 MAG: phosphate ABC transporter, permease protein PstA [Bdellovibrionales bacterium RIFOXYD1_FULL_39_84]OFZ93580.1 MAG: phosphate ABC transporter, permea
MSSLSEQMEHTFRLRNLKSYCMLAMIVLAFVVSALPLFAVFAHIIKLGFSALNFDFFTKLPAPVGESGGGLANALLGTAILVGIASVIGIPWGVSIGIYLSEYGKSKTASVVRFCVDMLVSIPSIVVGLFIYELIVIPMKGFSANAGGVALSILMIPTIARTTEEILKLIPAHVREAGLGLGIPRWKVTLFIIVRGSLMPISTGVILAISRVAGETAPLLFTALSSRFWFDGFNKPIASLSVQIFNYAISPFEDWQSQAWGGALLLVLFVFVVNLSVRILLLRTNTSKGKQI